MRYLRFPVSLLVSLTGAVFFFFSCSSDEISDGGLHEIRLVSDVDHHLSDTRGAGEITNSLEDHLSVSFVRTDQSASGSYPSNHSEVGVLPSEINKDNNQITLRPIQYYLPDGGETRLIGWYPADDEEKTGGKWNASAGTVTFPAMDGSTDILVAQPVYGSKAKDKRFSTITFSHALTQVQVFIKAENADEAKEYWGEVSAIEFVDKKQPCILTLPAPDQTTKTDTVAFAPDTKATSTNLKMIAKGDTKPHENLTLTDTDYIEVGYAMFAPHQNNTDAKLDIKITTTKGGTHIISIPYDKATLHAGGVYYIKLEFKLIGIELNGVIEAWKPSPSPDPIPVG